jgi:N-acetylmuramoyl-L-alanine amidase
MMPDVIDQPSPNFNNRKGDGKINMIIAHYTGMKSAEAALCRLCDPTAEVSAHYMIDEDGEIYHLVANEKRAWHAGRSYWSGEEDINSCSLGIELANPGHEFGYRAFPEQQIASFMDLCRELAMVYRIPRYRILCHSDIAPGRKQDPGELFPWQRLYGSGIGFWPSADFRANKVGRRYRAGDSGSEIRTIRENFRKFGYQLTDTVDFDDELTAVVIAFQRHWRQQNCDGIVDPETYAILLHLLDRLP